LTVVSKARAVGLKAAAFSVLANQLVFARLLDMQGRGVPIDLATLAEELKAAKELDQVGSYAFLTQISGRTPTTLRADYYLEKVKELWEARRGLQLTAEYQEAIYANVDGREGLRKASGELGQKLISFGQRAEVMSLAERVAVVRERVAIAAEGKEDRSRWLYTGLPTLDVACKPMGAGDEDHFIVIPGGSASGKSALMRQIGHNNIRAGKRVLVFSAETTVNGWIKKSAAQHVGVDLNNLTEAPRCDLKAFDEECAWMEEHAAGKLLWVVQNEAATPLVFIEDLIAHYDAFENLNGPPDLVIVDYLQMFMPMPNKKCTTPEQSVAYVSRALQGRCRRAKNVWLAGAQLNEDGLKEQRKLNREPPDEDGRPGRVIHRLPQRGDLRQSQQIFHDADRVIFIYRPPVTSAGEEDNLTPEDLRPEQWLVLGKKREGPEAVVKCWFEKRFTRFREFTREEVGMDRAAGGSRSGKTDWTKGE
jgi:replicative DNA helicase